MTVIHQFAPPPLPGAPPLQGLVREMLAGLGEDPARDGLLRTPERVEKSMRWLTRGYEMDVREVIGEALFAEDHDNMVLVRDIEFYSLCEHHMLPFYGQAHVAYIPDGRVVGLSKVARVVEVFARRLQVQERLTDQVADALVEALRPLHDDARRGEAELPHPDECPARQLPGRCWDPGRVSGAGAREAVSRKGGGGRKR